MNSITESDSAIVGIHGVLSGTGNKHLPTCSQAATETWI